MVKRCYHINTPALLTPGSGFLRSGPESQRGLIYSKWDGWTCLSHIPPLLFLSSPPSLPCIHTVPSLILGRISHSLTCFKADLHLGHRHSCPRYHEMFPSNEKYHYSCSIRKKNSHKSVIIQTTQQLHMKRYST